MAKTNPWSPGILPTYDNAKCLRLGSIHVLFCNIATHFTLTSFLLLVIDLFCQLSLQCFNIIFLPYYRAAFHTLLKMSKLLLTVVGYAQVTVVAEAIQPSDPSCSPPPVSASAHNAAVILQQALQYIPNPGTECMLRNMAVRLAGHLSSLVSLITSTLHVEYLLL